MAGRFRTWLARDWFAALFPLMLAVVVAMQLAERHDDPTFARAALLIDLCVVAPALFLICYRRRLAPRALAVRVVGIVCLGLFLDSWFAPAGSALNPWLGGVRALGVAVLVALELAVMAGVLKIVFARDGSADAIVARSGMPRVVAQLMLAEARFWRVLWRTLRGR